MSIFTSRKLHSVLKIIVPVITGILITFNSTAQILISPGPGVTPIDMVENIVGEGVQYENVTFQGAPISRGIFNNGNTTNLGLESGVFLTSGSGYNVPGPNSSGSITGANGMPGNSVLEGITTSTTYDAAVLEFDFIPESDTLRFKYVFGSDEYHEWANTSFNDVFGYFVTGPNPDGGMYTNENVAIIPGTSLPVTINNLNNGQTGNGP
ncbi:MAG: choice-of-anchor L domain-containing protein, partial [Bacteroidales bacterium]|nr:choice-of-anchor L domain-containing protein [Bacteroidales bacterium]